MTHTNNLISWLTADKKESIALRGIQHKNATRTLYLLQPNDKSPICLKNGYTGNGMFGDIDLTSLEEVKLTFNPYLKYEDLDASERCPYNGHLYPKEILEIDGRVCKNCHYFTYSDTILNYENIITETSGCRINGPLFGPKSSCSDFTCARERFYKEEVIEGWTNSDYHHYMYINLYKYMDCDFDFEFFREGENYYTDYHEMYMEEEFRYWIKNVLKIDEMKGSLNKLSEYTLRKKNMGLSHRQVTLVESVQNFESAFYS